MFSLAYLGGILTIISPCILPVLPFVFARADRPFLKSSLPLLTGMSITFAAAASIGAVGGSWAVQVNEYGRLASLVLLTVVGLTLLSTTLAERLARPFVQLGNYLSQSAGSGSGATQSFVLGIATGLLWAPCAGPILGLVLTGAVLQGASAKTTSLLLAYAAGAATSLAVALFAGGRVFNFLKRSLGAEDWIRRALGIAVLVGVAAVALGADRGVLTELSLASTSELEQKIVDRLAPTPATSMMMAADHGPRADYVGSLPDLSGATAWLNSKPLMRDDLKGKVVLVDFWTYSCINCLRSLPYIRAWAEKYKDSGLVVIGVHAPEFAFEKNEVNVRKAVDELGIAYPVAIDNNYAIWTAFHNEYWPAHYFIDASGRIRHHHFGEGEYAKSERVIQDLLKERNSGKLPEGVVQVKGKGVEAAAAEDEIQSPETYIGHARAQNFASAGGIFRDESHLYTIPNKPLLNKWGLVGVWTVEDEKANLDAAGGKIVFRFHARDLHLVLGPPSAAKPVRFRVTIDGLPPGQDHGMDTDAEGYGTVTEQRLYQLVRQTHAVAERTFQIEFLGTGAQAFAFTFG